MHRLSVMAGVFSAALMMSSASFAQVPADPNNPNEAVPDAMTLTPYGETINIETAKKAAAGAIAEAVKRNWNGLCVAIVATILALVFSGNLMAAQPMTLHDYMRLKGPPPTEHIAYGTAPSQYIEFFKPPGNGPFPVAVLLHGGCHASRAKHARQMALCYRSITKWNENHALE